MKRLIILSLFLIAGLVGCGNNDGLSGKYLVGENNKDNIEASMEFIDDNKVKIDIPEGDSNLAEQGSYKLSDKKSKNGYYLLTFENFERAPLVYSPNQYWFFDKQKMRLIEAEKSMENDEYVLHSEVYGSDSKILYLTKQ